ncbi:MAG: hypothetical protein ACK5YR_05640 [Pirellula sp.]
MPKQEIMFQAIILLLVLGAMFAFAVLGAFFVLRAVIRQKNQQTVDSTTGSKWTVHVSMPLIGLAIGLVIPTVWKLRLGEWEWIDFVRIILFGLIGAFFGGLIARLFGKLQKDIRRE